jgi:hypothetical protein
LLKLKKSCKTCEKTYIGDVIVTQNWANKKHLYFYSAIAISDETVFDHDGDIWDPFVDPKFQVMWCANCADKAKKAKRKSNESDSKASVSLRLRNDLRFV